MTNERFRKKRSILTVRSEVLKATRSWFEKERFIEVQGPIIVPSVSGSCNFNVDYFGNAACLTGGLQPYSDDFSDILGKVFCISPVFRKEQIQSNRHLAEFWQIETAMLDYDFEHLLVHEEQLVSHIVQQLAINALEDLTYLRCNIEDLKRVKAPFPRLTYDEAINKLQGLGHHLSWGQDLDWSSQRALSYLHEKPFFITHFPIGTDTLLFKSPKTEPHLTLSVDLLASGGYDEIASGGESINDKKELLDRLRGADISCAELDWYFKLKHPSNRARSGFALGIDRLLVWICGLKFITETNLYPRSFRSKFV